MSSQHKYRRCYRKILRPKNKKEATVKLEIYLTVAPYYLSDSLLFTWLLIIYPTSYYLSDDIY